MMQIINIMIAVTLIMIISCHGRSMMTSSHHHMRTSSKNSTYSLSSRMLYDHNLPKPVSVHEIMHRDVQQYHHYRSYDEYHHHKRRLEALSSELTPLYPGYGTHYAFLYIGTPPQRQSVIIDTGSHFTAFPCTGCQQCGQHTDIYYDVKNSSSAVIPDCKGKPCVISQSYSEGSSWRAFRVEDSVYVGGLVDNIPDAKKYQVHFAFGCQTFETGLFRTQLADGIMGLAMADDTLPVVLQQQGITASKIFSLCFRVGGGIMTLGGVDQRIHQKPGIMYAKLIKSTGWYSLNLLDIQFQAQKSTAENVPVSLGVDAALYNAGKGCIIDSGTTDTYLPSSIAAKFNALFASFMHVPYTTSNIQLAPEQLASIPNIVFTFQGVDDHPFSILMPWTSYVDSVGGGKYAFRIYLSEGQGVVLGANFMQGYNIIFDADDMKIGFAKSNCKYEDFMYHETKVPTSRPTSVGGADGGGSVGDDDISYYDHHDFDNNNAGCVSTIVAADECSARCPAQEHSENVLRIYGNQTYVDLCDNDDMKSPSSRSCSIICQHGKICRGQTSCPDKAWTTCSSQCLQSRDIPIDLRYNPTSPCTYTRQTRACYAGLCPYDEDDYIVYIDMRLGLDPNRWSYVYTEDVFGALSSLLDVKESSIELLNDASSPTLFQVKLHIQIRLKLKDYSSSLSSLMMAAEEIPAILYDDDFNMNFIHALSKISSMKSSSSSLDEDRYGWMRSYDVEVLNAVAMPLGEDRDPVEVPEDGSIIILSHNVLKHEVLFLLLGGLIACCMMLVCVCYSYSRLKSEFTKLSKEKEGGGLFKMFSKKWSNRGSKLFGKPAGYKEVQMMETIQDDDELDRDDMEGSFH